MPKRAPILLLAGLAIAALLAAERRWPLRLRTQPAPRRIADNVMLGALSLAVIATVQRPLAIGLAQHVEARGQGLVRLLPRHLQAPAAFLLLDYTMYLWHVATHRVPTLWRLHVVHHVDLDMDASTALRFHAADMTISVVLRLAQIRLIGVSPQVLEVWEAFFFASVLFHHSNLRVPGDTQLAWLLTTPGMHDIHHRAELQAQDSNWSSGLSLWDRLHGTLRLVPSTARMGVPAYPDAADASLAVALALPFMPQRPAWGDSGSAPPASPSPPAFRRARRSARG